MTPEDASAREAEEAPFRPRLRRRVLLRRILRGEGDPSARAVPAFGLPVYATLAGLLFCFYKLFQGLGAVTPAGDRLAAADPMRDAASPILWMILAAGLAGLLAVAMERPLEHKVGLRPGALREMAREGWTRLRLRLAARLRRPHREEASARAADEPAEAPARG